MVVKTYRGKEMGALLSQIKEELGEGAVILSTKHSRDSLIEIDVGTGGAVHSPMMKLAEVHEVERPLNSQTVARLEDTLLKQGLHPELARTVSLQCDATDGESVDRLAARGLEKLLSFESRLPLARKVVGLVGSTGVGKTTTIAKIAARMRMAFDIKIALVSADSYRVGAGYHLQTYASLLNLPFRMVDERLSHAEGITEAVESLGDFDLILVDTAGYSPRDSGRIKSLSSDLASLDWMEKLLVLPAPGNDTDLRASAVAYSQMGCSRVIISKTDETGFIGPVVNTLVALGKPVAFLTTGQRVPEDIEPASARRIGWMLTRTIH